MRLREWFVQRIEELEYQAQDGEHDLIARAAKWNKAEMLRWIQAELEHQHAPCLDAPMTQQEAD